MEDHLRRDASAVEFADTLGLRQGVSGYVYHTVPLTLYCWLRHPGNFRQAVEEVIALGGDTDSPGAVVGGIAGATLGAGVIPVDWLQGLVEWPRSVTWMRRLAERLARQFPVGMNPVKQKPLPFFWPGLIPRNLFLLFVALTHAFRRLLPPY
jgi:ADP-ribosyl-[dinitrogen reductase] hydrolase